VSRWKSFPNAKPYNKSFIDQPCLVKTLHLLTYQNLDKKVDKKLGKKHDKKLDMRAEKERETMALTGLRSLPGTL